MPIRIEKCPEAVAYAAFPDKMSFLQSELQERFSVHCENSAIKIYGDILFLPSAPYTNNNLLVIPLWARTALLNPLFIRFDSIGEAARCLSGMQRNWASCSSSHFRRTALIQEKLPYLSVKPRKFPFFIPHSPVGVYCLIDEHTMIASAETSSPLPAGTLTLCEDHENPPSRAYLKLQEALVEMEYHFNVFPQKGERCFDAGACPGGWTWVLTQLGCSVFAVDRSPLAAELMKHPLVEFVTHDAFTLRPEDIGPFDWVCSDVICYPERLFEWVCKWLESGLCNNMICTVKLQGVTDWQIIEKFIAVPQSRLLHLNYNKHEFTWLWHRQAVLQSDDI